MTVLAGRYELGEPLGAGGMARVVRAHDRLLDRPVAVKLLRDDIATDPMVRERFLREARTAARFNHPSAVAVFDTSQDDREPWIVMELIEGEDLSRRLAAGGALRESEAVRITEAVLAALAAAHRDGMVHRDVKPGNIMLLEDGRVKLADFGIAKSVQDVTSGMTATGQIIGTAKYLSPEQVEGYPATPASDVYAAGIVLYEMLAGDPPFTGDSAMAVALAHTRDPVPDIRRARPGISSHLAAVVERALEKDPSRRYGDAAQMRRALSGEGEAAAVGAAPTAVLTDGEPTRVLAPAPARVRGPWVLVALAAVALIGALALNAASDSNETSTGGRRGDSTPADDPRPDRPRPEKTDPEEEPSQDAPVAEEPSEEPTQPPADVPALPTDVPSLIEVLEASPGEYGQAQEELASRLRAVAGQGGPKQAGEARSLQEAILGWAREGQLAPDMAAVALTLLDPFTAEVDEQEGGNGKGNGKGKGKDEDDKEEDD